MADEIERPDIRRIMHQARTVVDVCAEQVRETVLANETWSETDSLEQLEQTILSLLLAGIKARAERRGIDWTRVEADTRAAMEAAAELPATDTVQ